MDGEERIVTLESVEEEMREATMRELRHLIEEDNHAAIICVSECVPYYRFRGDYVDKCPLSVYN